MSEQQETEAQESAPRKSGAFKKLLALAGGTCLLLLVLVTAILTVGRLLMPFISARQAAIETELGNLIGAEVSIGMLRGDWYRLGPVFDIQDLEIINADNPEASHVISSLSIRPDMLASLFSRSLVIDQVVVLGPEISLRQNPDGAWSLAGLAGDGNGDPDVIIDFLLNTGRMRIMEALLDLHWADGREMDVNSIYMDLSNNGNRHLVQVQARIDGQQSPFQLQLDFNGDPREQFAGSAFLHLSPLDVSEWASVPGMTLDAAEISGDFWISARQGTINSVQADVQSLTLQASGTQDSALGTVALDNASMALTLRHDRQDRWQGWLDSAEFDWQNRPWETGGIHLDFSDIGEDRPLEIHAASLDLAMVRDLLDDLVDLPEQASGALDDLAPQGRLTNMLFNTNLNGKFEGGFLLQGNLEDVSVGAWLGAPAGSGIEGYVQARGNSGFVEVATTDFEIHLPLLFEDSWHFDNTNSRVHWLVDEGMLHVNSSIIDVSNEFLHGHVQFDLYNHRDSSGDMQSELTLLIGLLEMDAAYKSLLLPTLPRIRNTMDWLDEALLAGTVTDSGFVSRTSTRQGAPANSGTILSWYNVEEGELKFQPDWPPLTDIKAFVEVDNNETDIAGESALIEGIALENAVATVRPHPDGGSWLAVQGSAETGTALGLAFMRNTPVRDNIGDFLDDWQGEGDLQVDIELGIPLNRPDDNTDVMVNVLSDTSRLTIPDYSLSIDALRGRVVYDSDSGLSANALSGVLFDFPIAATIEPVTTASGESGGTRIVGSGRASRNALEEWQGQPDFVRKVLNFASGEIDYLAEITIPSPAAGEGPGADTELRLSSELLGLSLDLPYPFNKSVDQIRPMELLINFRDRDQWVSASFDNRVGTNLQVTDDGFEGGWLVFGPSVREMDFGPASLEGPGLYIGGYLDSFNYTEWEQVATRFGELGSGSGGEQQSLEDFVTLADLDVGRLIVLDQDLVDVRTRLRRITLPAVEGANGAGESGAWLVNLENDQLSGRFTFPDAQARPWDFQLDYFRLPEPEETTEPETEDVDILADVNPADLPDLDFSLGELTIGSASLGAWEFAMRTSGDSTSISDLRMTTPDARITDESGEGGANLDWRFSDGMHTSSFTGLLSAGDLAEVLPSWGFDANVESESAAFLSNLQWTGSPAAFSLDKVVGDVNLSINDGRFVDVDSGGSRLFGAFSFDSLVRRLQLDFSDLYERGLAYDSIRGSLSFNRGLVSTNGEFRINGPSSIITIDGQINLIEETIDADMLVNVPLSQNLSVLAGILGGWPVAVSTYIASRIFQDQMDEFTTVLYRLDGPWENPSSGFEPSEEILEAGEVQADTGADTGPPGP